MIMQIPYVILEQYVQIGKKLQVIRKKAIQRYFKLYFDLHSSDVLCTLQ